MKTILVLNYHSSIDVITNSSSELFVVDSNSIETVKEMLEFMLKKWNELAAKGVFGEYYVKNNRKYIGNNNEEIPEINKFEDVFGSVCVLTKEHYNNTFKDDGWQYVKQSDIGKIIIESEGDNSIPGEIMEWIESAFGYNNIKRFHM